MTTVLVLGVEVRAACLAVVCCCGLIVGLQLQIGTDTAAAALAAARSHVSFCGARGGDRQHQLHPHQRRQQRHGGQPGHRALPQHSARGGAWQF